MRQHWAIAVSAERLGLNPLEFSWNLASHTGSSTCKIHCCTMRSAIVGIPRGLFLPLGFGISTRLTGSGTYQLNFLWISERYSSSLSRARFRHTRSCVLVGFQLLIVFRLEAIPLRAYWTRFIGTVPPLSLRQSMVIQMSYPIGFPMHHIIGLQPPPCPQLTAFR